MRLGLKWYQWLVVVAWAALDLKPDIAFMFGRFAGAFFVVWLVVMAWRKFSEEEEHGHRERPLESEARHG